MRILEVRDGFIKFESNEKVVLSSFIQIEDRDKIYIAQVIQSKSTGVDFIAYAKVLFLYNGAFVPIQNAKLTSQAVLSKLSFEAVSRSMYSNNPIVVGNFSDENIFIPMDKECFNNKTLVSIDDVSNKNLFLSNLVNQFATQGKVVIIDLLGDLAGTKIKATVDFKLPLNTSSLNFMYEDCLNDATSDSKNLIKDIFADLSEYSKTVEFLPFSALKTIVDNMVEKNHVFKLLVLKNKLAKFDKLGYFASNKTEAENITKILEAKTVTIDLSDLDSIFQNRYLSVIYALLSEQKEQVQVFVNASNAIDKKSLKTIMLSQTIASVLITRSRFKYLNEIKQMFENFVVEPSFTNNEIFKHYTKFLGALIKGQFLIVGKGTNYLPLISKFESMIVDSADVNYKQSKDSTNDVVEDVDIENSLEVSDLEDVVLDEETVVINKKSEDLIERVSEEVGSQKIIAAEDIFKDDEEECLEEELLNNTAEEIVIESQIVEQQGKNLEEEILLEEEPVETELFLEEISNKTPIENFVENDFPKEEPIIESNEQSIVLEVSSSPEFHTEIEEIQTIEVPEEISDLADEAEKEAILLENIMEEDSSDLNSDLVDDMDESPTVVEEQKEEFSVIPLDNESEEIAVDEIVELTEDALSQADIIVDIEDSDGEVLDPDALDREIVEDVDKVFTTMKEDAISDSDLDFIDELNGEPIEVEELDNSNSFEELPEMLDQTDEDEVLLEPIEEINESDNDAQDREILETRNTATPMVPVYNADIPAEDVVMSDPIEQGDTVIHAKHGIGVVEKMIKYGSKTLYSINFDNIGRRVLDPNITEIKKHG